MNPVSEGRNHRGESGRADEEDEEADEYPGHAAHPPALLWSNRSRSCRRRESPLLASKAYRFGVFRQALTQAESAVSTETQF